MTENVEKVFEQILDIVDRKIEELDKKITRVCTPINKECENASTLLIDGSL